jgi:hypothetical protein
MDSRTAQRTGGSYAGTTFYEDRGPSVDDKPSTKVSARCKSSGRSAVDGTASSAQAAARNTRERLSAKIDHGPELDYYESTDGTHWRRGSSTCVSVRRDILPPVIPRSAADMHMSGELAAAAADEPPTADTQDQLADIRVPQS